MKTKFFTLVSLLFTMVLLTNCGSPKPNYNNETVVNDTLKEDDSPMGDRIDVPGTYDFNGDGKEESCYLLEPQRIDEEMICEGDGSCHCLIMFSDNDIPSIELQDCIGGTPVILGDLDGNGSCEIGICPMWWTSCWQMYYIYTFVNGSWSFFVEPFSVHCNLLEELEETGESIIEPVSGQKDLFTIKYSEFDMDKGILKKTATVHKYIGGL